MGLCCCFDLAAWRNIIIPRMRIHIITAKSANAINIQSERINVTAMSVEAIDIQSESTKVTACIIVEI